MIKAGRRRVKYPLPPALAKSHSLIYRMFGWRMVTFSEVVVRADVGFGCGGNMGLYFNYGQVLLAF
jgi:hypothetical protein